MTVGGFGSFIRKYKKQIKNKRLTDYFELLDFTENVCGILKQFDVLLVPSLWKGGSLVPMEALICGIPVIDFTSNGLREVLSDPPVIMVETKNVYKLANAIVGLMNNKEHYKTTLRNFIPIAVGNTTLKRPQANYDQFITIYSETRGKKSDVS